MYLHRLKACLFWHFTFVFGSASSHQVRQNGVFGLGSGGQQPLKEKALTAILAQLIPVAITWDI